MDSFTKYVDIVETIQKHYTKLMNLENTLCETRSILYIKSESLRIQNFYNDVCYKICTAQDDIYEYLNYSSTNDIIIDRFILHMVLFPRETQYYSMEHLNEQKKVLLCKNSIKMTNGKISKFIHRASHWKYVLDKLSFRKINTKIALYDQSYVLLGCCIISDHPDYKHGIVCRYAIDDLFRRLKQPCSYWICTKKDHENLLEELKEK